MLTVLVPIKDSDATVVSVLPAVDPDNINVIYKHEGVYKRIWLNPDTNQYEYHEVIDREFPYLGKPLEIFDFTYDETRMGPAPTITAQGVMWFAEKDANGNDITLEGLWTQECHVSFNGENFYLKQVPTSSKSNEDARYKYDLDFVSETSCLEHIYLYDVVQPFVSERPISEDSRFSFYGDINELVKRINASMLRSGLATVPYKSGVTSDSYLTYEEFNSVGQGTYTGSKPTSDHYPAVMIANQTGGGARRALHKVHNNIYEHFGGNYTLYLLNEVFTVSNPKTRRIGIPGITTNYYDEIYDGEFSITGYQCRIGKDAKGAVVTSEEKLITFENNTIYEALQHIHDTFELQYYISREGDNTIIWIADCEHDFADLNSSGTDYIRDGDGIPTTESPFAYGVDNALLSIEKTNTTDKIVSRITGCGSPENLPWYYPNPTADGRLRPVYKRNGEELSGVVIDYPSDEGSTPAENTVYERYLKNRISNNFQYGIQYLDVGNIDCDANESRFNGTNELVLTYKFEVKDNSAVQVKQPVCLWETETTEVLCVVKKLQDGTYEEVADDALVSVFTDGGECTIEQGEYEAIYTFQFEVAPPIEDAVTLYWYDEREADLKLASSWGWSQVGTWATLLGLLPAWWGVNALVPGAAAATIAFYWARTHFTVRHGSFLSTNPNLHYSHGDGDANEEGWYSTDNHGKRTYVTPLKYSTRFEEWPPEGIESFEPKSFETYYAFAGGFGPLTTDNAPVLEIMYGGYEYIEGVPYHGWTGDSVSKYIAQCIFSREKTQKTRILRKIDGAAPPCSRFAHDYFDWGLTLWEGRWALNRKAITLSDYGIRNENTLSANAEFFDTIDFQRIKYLTPQPNLLPEIYIKSDGERRFYSAVNYPVSGRQPDAVCGESGTSLNVVNTIYQENENSGEHYLFENPNVLRLAREHIEDFEDVKPTIKGQYNYVPVTTKPEDWDANYSYYLYYDYSTGEYKQNDSARWSVLRDYFLYERADVIEEFAYDLTDNDEIWESVDNEEVAGEYKHPHFFAKLRPLGFNIFDLALQEDMVISMTTGHNGACNFKIKVDENTKKNPVQIWENNVYHRDGEDDGGEEVYTLVYKAGTLRRWCDTSDLYYYDEASAGYVLVDTINPELTSGHTIYNLNTADISEIRATTYKRQIYSTDDVQNGYVGALKSESKQHFAGDVKTNGRFIDSQQDTTENFVWVALEKDVDTYGAIMPAARPNYEDDNMSVYIRPSSAKDVHVTADALTSTIESTPEEDDLNADKFVFVNIKMPQVYLRRAEHELSRRLVAYMYDNNYQKFNFSIKFSRIFLAQNTDVDENLNANSVLYVRFNNKTYRQYVKHYTYKMSHDASLPEIEVDMNEELSVSRTMAEQSAYDAQQALIASRREISRQVNRLADSVDRNYVRPTDDVSFTGNVISSPQNMSMMDIDTGNGYTRTAIQDAQSTRESYERFVGVVNGFNSQTAAVTRGYINMTMGLEESDKCEGFYCLSSNHDILVWFNRDGTVGQHDLSVESSCPSDNGVGIIAWTNFSVS